jgi:hypothetical protein
MDLEAALSAALIVLVLASFPAVVWFFYFRRAMIRRIASVARSLEDTIKPRDKRYWYLGYLVGFKARYWVNRGPVKAVNAMYLVPPYHVFFYLPVIILGRRRERLDIAVEFREGTLVNGEAHIVNIRDRAAKLSFKRDVKDPGRLRTTKLRLGDVEAEAYYSGGDSSLDLARSLAADLSRRARLLRVTVDGGRKVLYASVNPNPGEPIDGIVEAVIDAAERLGGRP